MRYVLHKSKILHYTTFGKGTTITTLCRREFKETEDGFLNVADNDSEVTCKFCFRLMKTSKDKGD